jgi:hypothetical protein
MRSAAYVFKKYRNSSYTCAVIRWKTLLTKEIGVFYLKELDFQTRRKGINRDEEKRKGLEGKDTRPQHLIDNEVEAKQMMILRNKLEKEQQIVEK